MTSESGWRLAKTRHVPPARNHDNAVGTIGGFAAVSNTASAPRPFVIEASDSSNSGSEPANVAVERNESANSRRAGSRSRPIHLPPAWRINCTNSRPIEPKPTTTTTSDGWIPARFTARTQQANGSMKEASLSVRLSGIGKATLSTCSTGTRTNSANPPGSRLVFLNSAHIEIFPWQQ